MTKRKENYDMANKAQKLKTWIKDHEVEIKKTLKTIGVGAILGFGLGYITGDKITTTKIGNGYARFHMDGLIKYFDPSTGKEIDIMEACEVARKMYD
jgi:hypothetical protein